MATLEDKSRLYGKPLHLDIPALMTCFGTETFDFLEYAVLFGSRAIGTAHERSDYDIAVLCKEGENGGWGCAARAWNAVCDACGLKDIDVDIVDLARANEGLLHSIAEGYVLLKGDPDGFSSLLVKLRKDRRNGE
jgi:hypothetical protein